MVEVWRALMVRRWTLGVLSCSPHPTFCPGEMRGVDVLQHRLQELS